MKLMQNLPNFTYIYFLAAINSMILEALLALQWGSELKNILNFNCQCLLLQLFSPVVCLLRIWIWTSHSFYEVFPSYTFFWLFFDKFQKTSNLHVYSELLLYSEHIFINFKTKYHLDFVCHFWNLILLSDINFNFFFISN